MKTKRNIQIKPFHAFAVDTYDFMIALSTAFCVPCGDVDIKKVIRLEDDTAIINSNLGNFLIRGYGGNTKKSKRIYLTFIPLFKTRKDLI